MSPPSSYVCTEASRLCTSPTNVNLATEVPNKGVVSIMRSRLKAASYKAGGEDWPSLFFSLDKDHSGILSWEEFRSCCRRVLRIQAEDRGLRTVFRSLDMDASGEVSIQELVAFIMDPVQRMQWRLQEAVNANGEDWQAMIETHDKDKSGQISWTEFQGMCEVLRITDDKAQLQMVWEAVDRDKSGQISTQELMLFVAMEDKLPDQETVDIHSMAAATERRPLEKGLSPIPPPDAPSGGRRPFPGRSQSIPPLSIAPLAAERVAKFLLHQATHLFGILHCCYYRCLMNGAETLEETDGRPPYLCAMCLKKLHLVLGFDPLTRYLQLAEAWSRMGCDDTSRWYKTRVGIVRSTLASYIRSQTPPANVQLMLHQTSTNRDDSKRESVRSSTVQIEDVMRGSRTERLDSTSSFGDVSCRGGDLVTPTVSQRRPRGMSGASNATLRSQGSAMGQDVNSEPVPAQAPSTPRPGRVSLMEAPAMPGAKHRPSSPLPVPENPGSRRPSSSRWGSKEQATPRSEEQSAGRNISKTSFLASPRPTSGVGGRSGANTPEGKGGDGKQKAALQALVKVGKGAPKAKDTKNLAAKNRSTAAQIEDKRNKKKWEQIAKKYEEDGRCKAFSRHSA